MFLIYTDRNVEGKSSRSLDSSCRFDVERIQRDDNCLLKHVSRHRIPEAI